MLDSLHKLQKEFEINDQEPWTNLTLFFDKFGKFKVDFNYVDLSNVIPHEQKTIWKYKYLGQEPKTNSGKKYLEKYLNNRNENFLDNYLKNLKGSEFEQQNL
ncbi:immunity protein YezG family protein [Fictibacillus gelatini]|uniref:immunity protein YezG family protein n=1 Tax=Fictibacillus gelatini TaxID=225985 RepID=UPI002ADDC074|nr:immunity protein YezG family protein [Fictibacillus gelatini]